MADRTGHLETPPRLAPPPVLDYETSAPVENAPTPRIRCIEKDDEITIFLPAPWPSQFRLSSLCDRSMLIAPLRTWPGIRYYGGILVLAIALALSLAGALDLLVFWLLYLAFLFLGLFGSRASLSRYLDGDAVLTLDEQKLTYHLRGRSAQRSWQWDRDAIAAIDTRAAAWWSDTARPHHLWVRLHDGCEVRLPSIGSDADTHWIAQQLTRRLQGLDQGIFRRRT